MVFAIIPGKDRFRFHIPWFGTGCVNYGNNQAVPLRSVLAVLDGRNREGAVFLRK